MADEPRRSGRATKGQHTKNADEEETVEAPPAKAKGKGKRSKNTQTEEETTPEEEIVRCLCGGDRDDWPFTCCDKCNSWQHNPCMGLPDKYNPKAYFCEQCKPEDHVDTVAALNAGEKPSAVAARNRKGPKTAHQKRAGRKSQGGRQSVGGDVGQGALQEDAVQQPAALPTPVEQNKRKQTSEDSAQPSKLRKGSSHALDASAPKQSNSKAVSSLDSLKLVDSLEDLHNPSRKKTASGVKAKLIPLIKNSSASGNFRIPDGDTADSLAERLAVKLEYSLFMNHCGKSLDITDAYKRQTQTIIANVPSNPVLALNFFTGKITPDVLSTMSAGDMATDEQKKRDAKMKEENEKQAILVQEEGTRIRRTHKGEELVEDSGAQFASESITSNAPPRRMLSHDEGDSTSAGADQAFAGVNRGRPPPISTDTGSKPASIDQKSPPEARRSSSNFNIQNVWSNIQSPTGGHVRPMQQPARRSSGPVVMSPQATDEDIDRLLGDDEGDEAPYSPVETSLDPSLVWRGAVDMPIPQSPSIARFNSRAYHVAGADLGGREHSTAIFPHDIILAGRINAEAADQYLSSLSAARATDVSVFELIPASNEAGERKQFEALFHYLHSRSRFGVVSEKSHRTNVRDVYLVPLDEGAGPTPQFIQRLDHNIIESPRPRRMLVVVFVIRWKSPVPSAQPTPATPSAPIGSAMTPTVPGTREQSSSSMQPTPSPIPGSTSGNNAQQLPHHHNLSTQQSRPYQQPYQSSMPPNPYGPSGPQSYPPGPNYPQHQQTGQQLAMQILGPYYDSEVAQEVLRRVDFKVPGDLMENMRRIFEKYPHASKDFPEFQRILASGA